MKTMLRWLVVAVMAVTTSLLVWEARARVERLRLELLVEEERRREWAGLEAERSRLKAQEISADEQARLAEVQRALPELRARVRALDATLREPTRAPERRPGPVMAEWPAGEWRNAGRGTPDAATETALWAATGGEIEVLADAIVFDEGGRAAAERLVAGLPEKSRGAYATPERLIALLAAKDVPTGAVMAQVSDVVDVSPDETRLRVRLEDATGAAKSARLRLRRGADGWRMVVSERAVTKYAETLSGVDALGAAALSPR